MFSQVTLPAVGFDVSDYASAGLTLFGGGLVVLVGIFFAVRGVCDLIAWATAAIDARTDAASRFEGVNRWAMVSGDRPFTVAEDRVRADVDAQASAAGLTPGLYLERRFGVGGSIEDALREEGL